VQEGDVARLAGLQRELVAAGADLVRPGGTLGYSVCTLTSDETVGVDEWLAAEHPDLTPEPPPADDRWRPHGRGAILLPQVAGTDGRFLLRVRRQGGVAA
jgi:16S rRNA (cytosine967-C5)-methyltransferase